MLSFLLCIVALILGYALYGAFVDRVFSPDPNRVTPAISKTDGVDFIPLPTWKVFMIQFLNIAGTGPIFGAIMGAKFGPASYLWIVLGCIFAGAVHDYFVGMLSLRHGGAGLPELVGSYLGNGTRKVMLVFSVVLLLLVGTVFVYSPALILGDMAGDGSRAAIMLWVGIIFIYYIVATLLPIDKIIGKIYPVFAIALLFMAAALMVCLFIKWPSLPEIWDGLQNRGPSIGLKGQPIFPCLFITIACGAISGFHATQSPLMARCLKNEKLGRPVFYGSMITEGLVALIWAAVSSYFFFDGGAAEVGSDLGAAAPTVVTKVSQSWLGILESGPEACAQPPYGGDSPVRRRLRPAVVQCCQRRRFQHNLALLRLGQPDAGDIRPLDGHRVSGQEQEGGLVSTYAAACRLYVGGVPDIHLYRQDRLPSARFHQPVSGLRYLPGSACFVLLLAPKSLQIRFILPIFASNMSAFSLHNSRRARR